MSLVRVLNQEHLKAEKCVQVSYALDASVEPSSSHYVAVSLAGSDEGDYVTYSYASETRLGQVGISLDGYESTVENQSLEIRFYDQNGQTVASCPFTFSGDAVEEFHYSFLQASVYELNAIATFQLAQSEGHVPSSSDYIGVCEAASEAGAYFCYSYCAGARSGSVAIYCGGWESSLEGITLVLRYYSPSNTTILESEPFTFTNGASTTAVPCEPTPAPVKVAAPTATPQVPSQTYETPPPVQVKEEVKQSIPAAVKTPPVVVSPAPKQVEAVVKSQPALVAQVPQVVTSVQPSSNSAKPARPTKQLFTIVDGSASGQRVHYQDSDPSDIPSSKCELKEELARLQADYRPVAPKPAASAPSKPKKKGFFKALASGINAALEVPVGPDPRKQEIESLEEQIREQEESFARARSLQFDQFLSSAPRPCKETAALRVGMILEGKPICLSGSVRPTYLYELRDIDGPMLHLHPLHKPAAQADEDFWIMYNAPVLGALGTLGGISPSGDLRRFSPNGQFFYDDYLRHMDRAPVPKSYFSFSRPPMSSYLQYSCLSPPLYTPGSWSAANLPAGEPLQDTRFLDREDGFGSTIPPDYSLLSSTNLAAKTTWNAEIRFRLNQTLVTPQELLTQAQSGKISWNTDILTMWLDGSESKGRTWSPIAASPWVAMRRPSSVTASTPLPWFLLYNDPPVIDSGRECQICWQWDAYVLVSFDELSRMVQSEEVSSHALITPFQCSFWDDNGMPNKKSPMFVQAAWVAPISYCPRWPVVQGRETMDFWIRSALCTAIVTFQELEEACVAAVQTATDTSFMLPLAAYPGRFSFDSKVWPCQYPMPHLGWKTALVPKVFHLFPGVLATVSKNL